MTALLIKFRRQQVLGPIIVDFCCLEAALIVEVDGPYLRLSITYQQKMEDVGTGA